MTGINGLLRLYPARYRTEHGDEIAAVFEEATEGLTGRALLRERTALAAHALRIRAGIGSAQAGGRALAAAAPFALGALASIGAPMLLAVVSVLSSRPQAGGWAEILVPLVDALPSVLALVCALAGRRTATRVMLLLAVVEKLALLPLASPASAYVPWYSALPILGSVAFALLALAAPPDLRAFDGRRAKAVLLGTTTFSIAPVYLFGRLIVPHSGVHGFLHLELGWPAVFPAAALLAALVGVRADLPRAAGAAVAALPWIPMLSSSDPGSTATLILTAAVCSPLLGALGLAVLLRVARRGRVAQPLDPA
ncbi:hypothetical protein [Streptacidiphilus rugosus]|uniref:hypothetical protein n=1 Tax=Streptacidiphilus rugosus TaxID=405783 RepID=UPI00068E70D1|nr:hypothetical protein [Streptacidiphilus rugosus]